MTTEGVLCLPVLPYFGAYAQHSTYAHVLTVVFLSRVFSYVILPSKTLTVADFGRTPAVVAASVSTSIHLTDTVAGITSGSDTVKIVQPGQTCTGLEQTGGSAVAISGSSTDSAASYSLSVVSADNVICFNDGGGFVDTLQRITVSDMTPPSLVDAAGMSSVSMSGLTQDGGTLKVTSTEAGVLHWVVLLQGVAEPALAAIKNGNVVDAKASGTNVALGAGTEAVVIISGLAKSTAYTVWVAAEDDATVQNMVSSASSKSFTTTIDNTSPTITSLAVSALTQSGGQVTVTSSEAGFVHYAVVLKGAAAPSMASIVAGTATGAAASGTKVVVAAAVAKSITISALTKATDYEVFIVAEDDAVSGNLVATASSVSLATTIDGTPPTISSLAISSLTDSGGTLKAISTETGVLHWAVVLQGTSAPTLADIKADAVTGAKASGTSVVLVAGIEKSIAITGSINKKTVYTVWVAVEDDAVSPNLVASASSVSFTTAADTTAPTQSGVSVSSVTAGEATLQVTSNDEGNIYWAVLLASAATPSASSIEAKSVSGAVQSGSTAVKANQPALMYITGLLTSVGYSAYVLPVDEELNSGVVTKENFISAADTTAPVLSGAAASAESEFKTTMSMTSDDDGFVHWAVLLAAATAPSALSIKAGSAVGTKKAGVVAVSANIKKTADITGLVASAELTLYLAVEDEAGNVAAAATAVSFSTPADVTKPVFSGVSVTSAFETAASLVATLDDDGSMFWVVLPKIYSPPSLATVKAGNDGRAKSQGSVTVQKTVPQRIAIKGLTAGTTYTVYLAAVDEVGNPAVSMSTFTFSTGDSTAPVLSGVAVTAVTGTSGVLKATSNEAGTLAWAVLVSGAAVLSPAEVKAGNAAGLKAGGTQVATQSNVEVTLTMAGLVEDKAYDLYVIVEDKASNIVATAATATFTTLDLTPPLLSTITVTEMTAVGATFSVTSNETGLLWWVVVSGSAAAPSVQEIKSGSTAGMKLSGKNVAVVANVEKTIRVTGLERTVGTAYNLHVAVEDGSSNLVATAQESTFTTTDGLPPVISQILLSPATKDGAMVSVAASETGLLHWAVLVAGAAVPSASSLKLGAAPGAKKFGVRLPVIAGNETSFTITGLAEGTSYKVYIAAEDALNNLVASASQAEFTTFAVAQVVAPDTTKPQLSGVSVGAVAETGTTVFAISSKGGKMHWAILPASAVTGPAPAVANIIAGTVTGAEAFGINIATIAAVENAIRVSTLVASTPYIAFIVAEDTAIDTVSIVGRVTFTTPAWTCASHVVSPVVSLPVERLVDAGARVAIETTVLQTPSLSVQSSTRARGDGPATAVAGMRQRSAWTCTSNNLDMANDAMFATERKDQPQPSLVVLPHSLTPGTTYTFRLRVWYEWNDAPPPAVNDVRSCFTGVAVEAIDSIVIKTRVPPRQSTGDGIRASTTETALNDEKCSSELACGYATSTKWTVELSGSFKQQRADGVLVEASDELPLRYGYSYVWGSSAEEVLRRIEDRTITLEPLTELGSKSSATSFVLPTPPATSYSASSVAIGNAVMVVEAVDKYGSTGRAAVMVAVREKVFESADSFAEDLLGRIDAGVNMPDAPPPQPQAAIAATMEFTGLKESDLASDAAKKALTDAVFLSLGLDVANGASVVIEGLRMVGRLRRRLQAESRLEIIFKILIADEEAATKQSKALASVATMATILSQSTAGLQKALPSQTFVLTATVTGSTVSKHDASTSQQDVVKVKAKTDSMLDMTLIDALSSELNKITTIVNAADTTSATDDETGGGKTKDSGVDKDGTKDSGSAAGNGTSTSGADGDDAAKAKAKAEAEAAEATREKEKIEKKAADLRKRAEMREKLLNYVKRSLDTAAKEAEAARTNSSSGTSAVVSKPKLSSRLLEKEAQVLNSITSVPNELTKASTQIAVDLIAGSIANMASFLVVPTGGESTGGSSSAAALSPSSSASGGGSSDVDTSTASADAPAAPQVSDSAVLLLTAAMSNVIDPEAGKVDQTPLMATPTTPTTSTTGGAPTGSSGDPTAGTGTSAKPAVSTKPVTPPSSGGIDTTKGDDASQSQTAKAIEKAAKEAEAARQAKVAEEQQKADTAKRKQMETIRSAVGQLGNILLSNKVVGEKASTVTSPNIQIRAQRSSLSDIEGTVLVPPRPPRSEDGQKNQDIEARLSSFMFSPGTFTSGQAAKRRLSEDADVSSVDVSADVSTVRFSVNVHAGWGPDSDVASSVTSLTVRKIGSTEDLAITHALPAPVLMDMPFTLSDEESERGKVVPPLCTGRVSDPAADTNGSSASTNTSNHTATGASSGFSGLLGDRGGDQSCGLATAGQEGNASAPRRLPTCAFWNETTHQWSSKGCRAVGLELLNSSRYPVDPAVVPAVWVRKYVLQCSCDHLTDFAARMKMFDAVLEDLANATAAAFDGRVFTAEAWQRTWALWIVMISLWGFLLILVGANSAKQLSKEYTQLQSNLMSMHVALGLKLLRTTPVNGVATPEGAVNDGTRPVSRTSRKGSVTKMKGKAIISVDKSVPEDVLDAMIVKDAQGNAFDTRGGEAFVMAQVRSNISQRSKSGGGLLTRSGSVHTFNSSRFGVNMSSVALNVMNTTAKEDDIRREEIRDIVDNKLSAGARSRLAAALADRRWFFQPKVVALTQSTTRAVGGTEDNTYKRVRKVLSMRGKYGGHRCCGCCGGFFRKLCSMASLHGILRSTWKGIKNDHEVLAIFMSNPDEAPLSKSTFVVLLGVLVQTMILVEACFWRIRYASDNKISSENFDFVNYILAMVAASLVSTILTTILRIVIIKREQFKKSRRILGMESVTTIKPRVLLSGEFYVRWNATLWGATATPTSSSSTPPALPCDGAETKGLPQQMNAKKKSSKERFGSLGRQKGQSGAAKGASSEPSSAAAATKVSPEEVKRRPWIAGYTAEQAEACTPQHVVIYAVGERFFLVSFDKLPENGGRATGRYIIDGYSKVSQRFVSMDTAAGGESKSENARGNSGAEAEAGKVWHLLLQGGNASCELYSPDNIDHHKTFGADCEWSDNTANAGVAPHVWYAAILQLIKKDHDVDNETIKHRNALDKERAFVAKKMDNPPVTDLLFIAVDAFFGMIFCGRLRQKCCSTSQPRVAKKKMKTKHKTQMKTKKKRGNIRRQGTWGVKQVNKGDANAKTVDLSTVAAAHKARTMACFREESDCLVRLNRFNAAHSEENEDRFDSETVRAILEFDTKFEDERRFDGDQHRGGEGEEKGAMAIDEGAAVPPAFAGGAAAGAGAAARQGDTTKATTATVVQKELKLDQDEIHLLRSMTAGQQIRFYESKVKLRHVGCCGRIFVHLSNIGQAKQKQQQQKFGSARRAYWPHVVNPFVFLYIGFCGYLAIAFFIFREEHQQFEFLRLLCTSLTINFLFIRPLICWVEFGLAPAIGHRLAQTISVAIMTVAGLGGILSTGEFNPLLDFVPYVVEVVIRGGWCGNI